MRKPIDASNCSLQGPVDALVSLSSLPLVIIEPEPRNSLEVAARQAHSLASIATRDHPYGVLGNAMARAGNRFSLISVADKELSCETDVELTGGVDAGTGAGANALQESDASLSPAALGTSGMNT